MGLWNIDLIAIREPTAYSSIKMVLQIIRECKDIQFPEIKEADIVICNYLEDCNFFTTVKSSNCNNDDLNLFLYSALVTSYNF